MYTESPHYNIVGSLKKIIKLERNTNRKINLWTKSRKYIDLRIKHQGWRDL